MNTLLIKQCSKNRSGFAIAELLVYLAILGVIGALLTGILTSISKIQIEESAQNELSGQLNFSIRTIQRLVKATDIISMSAGVASSTLTLQYDPDNGKNPTLIYASSSVLYVQEGANTPQSITSDKVHVDSLEFKRFVQTGGKDVVQVDLALSLANKIAGKTISRSLRFAVMQEN